MSQNNISKVKNILSFSEWLIKESFGEDHDFSNLTPAHSYKTADGHHISVHIMNNKQGKHAVFYNHNLDGVVKLTQWAHTADQPSNDELEHMGKDEIDGHHMHEGEHKTMTNATAGAIAEHATALRLIDHQHYGAGTHGSSEHHHESHIHMDAINSLAKGHNPDDVNVRMRHGATSGDAIHSAITLKHGPSAKIVRVGHTAKPGDIERFTKGKHKDSQDNPSDVAVEVKHSAHSKSGESMYEGASLKSSSKATKITAKNPAIHMDGMLDTPSRKLKAEKVSRTGISNMLDGMGAAGKTAAERGKMIDVARGNEGTHPSNEDPKKRFSKLESIANEKGLKVKEDISKEFHAHLHHLSKNEGDEGHHIIGKMLSSHLTNKTSMPWSKIHAKGTTSSNTTATVTPGSESPLNKVLNNKNTKYAVTRSGARTTIHKVEKDGSHTSLAHYSPKTKANIFKSDVHGWNVIPGEYH